MTAPARSISVSGDPFVSISKPLSLPLPFNSSYIELHGATLRASRELGDSNKINPPVPVDLVIDHSVQVDVKGQRMQCRPIWSLSSKETRKDLHFLNGGQMLSAIHNMLVVPLVLVFVVGTFSHTTMIDGLGVAGWGVGGIEAEAAMLGQEHNI
ncbi:hypothetical protein K1719_034674 [Acacia pycnantha]|nr:hypothetical protein K1719_034674 [Acacia pycnantha]